MSQSRHPTRIVESMPTSDGAGVRLKRALGTPRIDMLDPFLMLDEFYSDDAADYIKGFPNHPHRGFETVNYMLAGRMEHRDSVGNRGQLEPGSVQWMTAGRGIIHSEMPQQRDGLMWGFQLWVNLPASDKMTAPRYQDIPRAEIPVAELPGGERVKVIAGRYETPEGEVFEGPVGGVATQPLMLDIELKAGEGAAPRSFDLPAEHNAFVYVFEGVVTLGEGDEAKPIPRGRLAVLSKGERLQAAVADGADAGRFLLLAGKPIGEPVARYGPFVMNTREELEQAFADYRSGRLAT